jgi:Smg protein
MRAAATADFFDEEWPTTMTGSVLDILIYVFDRYMLEEVPEVPERDDLARQLESAGFAHRNVQRALDWLAELASVRDALPLAGSGPAVRVFAEGELSRLSTECRGFLLTLERMGILSSQQREVVIERMLALDADELDTEQLKWVVLMVLSSQPDQQHAFARLENLVSDTHTGAPH